MLYPEELGRNLSGLFGISGCNTIIIFIFRIIDIVVHASCIFDLLALQAGADLLLHVSCCMSSDHTTEHLHHSFLEGE